ncbi:hypothetical protein P170DRAFT_432711 [Aspergillus steynii IBT 23096]|uniref:Uncharacterized protein n=1 Tax=Aspergillus steynii IBT 23096 TaxID=1392250 RepID=A0A2I2GQN9_9EURO|nr:uncharacterized protein P170DRAFT_432711 [Aspergillus steynii IBT 23096]PLB55174.1 hypothetical protein P170DRAFT_432711 [Aspergillus steynii IBT 23096]
MSSIWNTIITLPLLLLISIPLITSACFTIFLAFVTLFIRFSFVYIKLLYGIISSYFTIPTPENTSLLSFAASEPTTPGISATPKRRSLDYGLTPLYSNSLAYRQSFSGPGRPDSLRRRQSSNSSEGRGEQERVAMGSSGAYIPRESFSMNSSHPPTTAFLGLTSGDEGRDFEGVGGWRTQASSIGLRGYLSGSASPSPNDSVSDEADERAWLSINERLQLPTQSLTLGHSYDSPENPFLWGSRQRSPAVADAHRERHHHRSATTSMIPNPGSRGSHSSASLSNRPAPHRSRTLVSPHPLHRRMSHDISPTSLAGNPPRMNARSVDGSEGYFAVRRGSAGSSRSTTSGSSTPFEEHMIQGPMAHHSIGVKHRKNIPGPNSGSRLRRHPEAERTF